MNILTKIKPQVYVYFAYEDYDGYTKYSNYEDAKKTSGGYPVYLTGYCFNSFYNCSERIHEIELKDRKPTISEVKKLIRDCYNCMQH